MTTSNHLSFRKKDLLLNFQITPKSYRKENNLKKKQILIRMDAIKGTSFRQGNIWYKSHIIKVWIQHCIFSRNSSIRIVGHQFLEPTKQTNVNQCATRRH